MWRHQDVLFYIVNLLRGWNLFKWKKEMVIFLPASLCVVRTPSSYNQYCKLTRVARLWTLLSQIKLRVGLQRNQSNGPPHVAIGLIQLSLLVLGLDKIQPEWRVHNSSVTHGWRRRSEFYMWSQLVYKSHLHWWYFLGPTRIRLSVTCMFQS